MAVLPSCSCGPDAEARSEADPRVDMDFSDTYCPDGGECTEEVIFLDGGFPEEGDSGVREYVDENGVQVMEFPETFQSEDPDSNLGEFDMDFCPNDDCLETKIASVTRYRKRRVKSTPYMAIVRAMDKNKIPRSMLEIYLGFATIESDFKFDSISASASAAGIFQFVPENRSTFEHRLPLLSGILKIHNPALYRGSKVRLLPISGRRNGDFRRNRRAHASKMIGYRNAMRRRFHVSEGEPNQQYYDSMTDVDSRFDYYINSLLATRVIYDSSKRYQERWCYFNNTRTQDADRVRRGRERGQTWHCVKFSPRDARLLAAADFHMGCGAAYQTIWRGKITSLTTYLANARRARGGSGLDKNERYIRLLNIYALRYRRLNEDGSITREEVNEDFRGRSRSSSTARNMFAVYEIEYF